MNTTPKSHFIQNTFFYQDKPFRMLQAVGETWFVAADICTALGLPQVSRAVRRIDPGSTQMVKVSLPQQPKRAVAMNVVDAAGLEQMTLLGTKQATVPFRRWLRREVIPVQRWCEGAAQPATITTSQTANDALESENVDCCEAAPRSVIAALPGKVKLPRFTRRDLLALAIEAEDECEAWRQKNAALPPRTEAYDRLAKSKDSYSLGETAKLLGIPLQGRNNLIRFLRCDGILMEGNIPKQRYIDCGHFSVVQQEYDAPDGSPHVRPVTRVHASGVEFIRSRMANYIRRRLVKPCGY